DLLQPHLPYAPHDYQLEGVCKLLDDEDVVVVLPTGAGKTGFYAMYMLALRSLSQQPPPLKPVKDIPLGPGMLIIYPTLSLEEEMEHHFKSLGLSTLVINNRTARLARKRGENLWETARAGISMILISPEMLQTDGYSSLVEDRTFTKRACLLGVDEFHLCNSWGLHFRPAFTQIGFARMHLPKRIVLLLTTATLAAGEATENVCTFFGLREGAFHFIRHSNIRPDVQLLFRTLTRGLSGPRFPDFRWVLKENRKTIIFCPRRQHGDRLATYLCSIVPGSPDPQKRIRLYNALHWEDFNGDTLRVFREDLDAQIVVATDTLMVGLDVLNVCDVILATVPVTVDEFLQKIGWVGRDRHLVNDARGIVYNPKNTMKKARAIIDKGHQKKKTGGEKNAGDEFDLSMAHMLLADCKIAEQNHLYDNPTTDPPCTCSSCQVNLRPIRSTCDCSGCVPEDLPDRLFPMKKAMNSVKRKDRLSRGMRDRGKD
ncbi:P-loop containing nucleoside triphosphate hydrolase protein, partial [Sparassis latifolia]